MTRSTELEQSLTNADREPLVPRSNTRQIRIDARKKTTLTCDDDDHTFLKLARFVPSERLQGER